MSGDEIRQKFLDYFSRNGHRVVTSCSLIPKNDPTLLFTNAGMVQFKEVFLGKETRDYVRAASVQKCVRAGGKHNDLEMVGRTARHHTFFEMLGNFSFGDYFKKEAIRYSWDFLTEVIQLPIDRLYATVYTDDDEAYGYWKNDIGLSENRLFRFGEKDNFWSMGPTGPCGPCSEIFIDQGERAGCGKPTCAVGCDCDRYLEIWNLVFMQYDRDQAGKLSPLPNPCIDTGMGLERLAAVVQGKIDNFDSDLMAGIISKASEVTETAYGKNKESDVSLKVIADHARAAAFLISDGVFPSNEGRGYVLRRIVRRALRHGKLLEKTEPFLNRVTDHVVEQFQGTYSELADHRTLIKKIILNEEESFSNTLNYGSQLLEEILQRLKKANRNTIPGEEIFKLYDTFGFPVDLMQDIGQDQGFTLDMAGFDRAMKEQREKAMASWRGSGEKELSPFFKEFLKKNPATVFRGYQDIRDEGKVLAILKDQREIESAAPGEEVEILLDTTPFYGESGGQVGDTGHAFNESTKLDVVNTTKPLPELISHKVKVVHGTLRKNDSLTLQVDAERRQNTVLNHTATHLLHAALKNVLGDQVKQAGSLVAPDRLRFDYTHFSPLTDREKSKIERLVNEKIQENTQVSTDEMSIDDALQKGAVALFGEKYGNDVRVVSVTDFSKELCGGTHVSATGNIGIFKIISEGSIASGIRRIEAVTGLTAYEKIQNESQTLNSIRSTLKAQPEEELNRLKKLLEKSREMEREIATLKEKLVSGKGFRAQDEITKIGDVSVLIKNLEGMDPKTLRSFIDSAKNRIKSGVVVVGTAANGKAMLAAGVTKDLTERFHAGNILKEIAQIVGGTGGGRPDMAQAGGSKPEMLDQALQKVPQILSGK